jgi:hypothetical protein
MEDQSLQADGHVVVDATYGLLKENHDDANQQITEQESQLDKFSPDSIRRDQYPLEDNDISLSADILLMSAPTQPKDIS